MVDSKKNALRKILLEKRDGTSAEMKAITSKQIQKKIQKIKEYTEATSIASYYPIGSEVLTQSIMQDILSRGVKLSLPKIINDMLEYRQITDFTQMEIGKFDIPEPREDAKLVDHIDVILVPALGLSKNGNRIGYGRGYFDKFLAQNDVTSIALSYSKQLVGNIPTNNTDIPVNWIVTEDQVIKV